jgi:non-ribosomal peptide synthetase component F
MLSHNDEGGELLVLDGARARRLHLPARAAKLDLIVDAKVIDGELHLYWESDRDLFDPTLVTSLVEEFDRWLNRGLADPNRALTELVAPAAPAGPDQTAPSAYERFTSAWDRRWDEVAYTEAGTALTAAALHGRVVAMADRLTGLGLGRQSVVATRSGAVLDHVVMMLTCSRIGATHVPLDTASPERRTRDMLDQCGADVLVLPPGEHLDGPPVLSTSGLADGTPVTPVRQSSSTALSHIMYTSGSTGRAKGVRIDNAALNSYVAGINAAYGIDGAAVAQCGNPAYDVFVEEIGLSILVGNRMAVLPPELRGDPAAFAEFVRAERIELLPLPTSYWAFLVGAMADADFAKLRDVRVCAIGGEDYPPAAARTWFERFPEQPRLYNVYGPTENGPVSTVVELRPDTPPSTLGGPLGDVRCEVRSRFGTPVPNGGRGELWLSGPQLFRGYVDGPTVAEYRTGDIVLRDPEHGLRYVERAGSMMKISGFRVEAGEYLAVVADLPGVTDARVAANPARTGVVIYATVDGRADEPAIAEAVAARVRESLPRYMRGYELRFCRDVPLTPNGKADFRELAERSWPAPAPVVTATPAVVGPVEEVREIWRHVLGADRVDDEAGFFDQGGSSLEMLQLLAGLEERFPGTFALIDLYDRPSIRHQARHVHERAAGARPGSAEPAESAARERLARKRRARRQNRSER